MNRRDFLRTAGGTAGGTAALTASGSASAAEDGGEDGGGGGSPDYGGYLNSANNYDGNTVDARGQDEVTIEVGAGSDGLAFGPAAVWVDVGTSIIWEWTGEGGAHNVISDNSDVDSGGPVSDAGTTYEVNPEESQIIEYYCSPHQSQGMLGAVAVGDDIPIAQPSEGPGEPELHDAGVDIQEHFVGVAVILAMCITSVFTFFVLKYGESPNTKGGSN
jgi:halocyanin-like protein